MSDALVDLVIQAIAADSNAQAAEASRERARLPSTGSSPHARPKRRCPQASVGTCHSIRHPFASGAARYLASAPRPPTHTATPSA